jgi:hypothetical protein
VLRNTILPAQEALSSFTHRSRTWFICGSRLSPGGDRAARPIDHRQLCASTARHHALTRDPQQCCLPADEGRVDSGDLEGNLDAQPTVLARAMVWRSVRAGGNAKTGTSRRTLALPHRCVEALREHRERQAVERQTAGGRWVEGDLVFASANGTKLDVANVRRGFRRVATAAGLNAAEWTPREVNIHS